jgi:hypothetical protein
MTQNLTLIAEALAYVTEIYREVAQENGSATLGTQNQMVEFVLSDDKLRKAAHDWSSEAGGGEATIGPYERLPLDEAYGRVRERMLATM